MGIAGATVAVVAGRRLARRSPRRCSRSGARKLAPRDGRARGGPLAPPRARRHAAPRRDRRGHRGGDARRRAAGAERELDAGRRLGDPEGQERAGRRRRARARRRRRRRRPCGRRRRAARPPRATCRPSPPASRLAGVEQVAPPAPSARDTWQLGVDRARAIPPAPAAQQVVNDDPRAPRRASTCAVGGDAAEFVDQQAAIGRGCRSRSRCSSALTFVVLWLMTGSIVLPLKAVLMNALTVGAALAPLVLIYQGGRLTGCSATRPTAASSRPTSWSPPRSSSRSRPTTACSCSAASRRRATAG